MQYLGRGGKNATQSYNEPLKYHQFLGRKKMKEKEKEGTIEEKRMEEE